MRRIIELVDWAARLHFIGTTAFALGGWAVTFFAASAGGWGDPVAIWIASVFVGSCCAFIFLAIKARRPEPRVELLEKARQFVLDATAEHGAATDFGSALEASPIYLALRPHLSPAFLETVKNAGQTFIVPPQGSNLPGLAHAFLEEIDRIEKEDRSPMNADKADADAKKAALEAFSKSLYVPKIEAQWPENRESDPALYITIWGKTGAEGVSLHSIEGDVTVRRDRLGNNENESLGSLPWPRFHELRQSHFDPYREFYFILRQELSERVKKEMFSSPQNERYVFDFQNLHIFVQSDSDSRKIVRLPLWDAAVLWKQGAGIVATRRYNLGPGNNVPITQ